MSQNPQQGSNDNPGGAYVQACTKYKVQEDPHEEGAERPQSSVAGRVPCAEEQLVCDIGPGGVGHECDENHSRPKGASKRRAALYDEEMKQHLPKSGNKRHKRDAKTDLLEARDARHDHPHR